MGGLRALRPPKAKYTEIWDAGVYLTYLEDLPEEPLTELPMGVLRRRTVMLLRIARIARSSDVVRIPFHTVDITPTTISFKYYWTKEQRAPGYSRIQTITRLENEKICPYRYFRRYMQHTQQYRELLKVSLPKEEHTVFLKLTQDHGPIKAETCSKDAKKEMEACGIDTGKYSSATVRHAAATRAIMCGASVEAVLEAGRWTSRQVFEKFYNRAVRVSDLSAALFGAQ